MSPDEQVRRWIFRFTSPVTRKVTETGLGLVESVPLADAQDKVIDLRRQIAKGICPNAAKREAKLVQMTFAEVAEAWIETHKSSWRSKSQVRNTKAMLRNHGTSQSGMTVGAITPDDVQSALDNQWGKHPVSARRTLAMFERIFDYTKAKGFRTGDNPAAWIIEAVPIEYNNPANVKSGIENLRKIEVLDESGTLLMRKWIGPVSICKDLGRAGRRIKNFWAPADSQGRTMQPHNSSGRTKQGWAA